MNSYIGKVAKVLYRNGDFLIAKMQTKVEELVIKGSIFGVDKGEEIQVQGDWETHPKFGKQLAVTFWKDRYRKRKIRLSLSLPLHL